MTDLFLRQALAIADPDVKQVLGSLGGTDLTSFWDQPFNFGEFYQVFERWVNHSELVSFKPPSQFTPVLSQGVTEAFTNFYLLHQNRQLRLLRGEYPFHRDTFSSMGKDHQWFENPQDLSDKDFVIISTPFSGSGNPEPILIEILKACDQKKIPVMLDLAFLGLGASYDFTSLLNHSCVEQFSFSFSKMFNLSRYRVGVTWMRNPCGPLSILNNWNYTNWPGALVAQKMMENFKFDDMAKKYLPFQKKLCVEHGLTPSQTYLFGIGGAEFNAFSRDGVINRVCLTQLLNP